MFLLFLVLQETACIPVADSGTFIQEQSTVPHFLDPRFLHHHFFPFSTPFRQQFSPILGLHPALPQHVPVVHQVRVQNTQLDPFVQNLLGNFFSHVGQLFTKHGQTLQQLSEKNHQNEVERRKIKLGQEGEKTKSTAEAFESDEEALDEDPNIALV